MNIAASLPDERYNTFYARFEADNTAHTESAPTAAAEEVSPLSLSVADVTRSFKRVNIRKAVGPDGIPGRVLKACVFQLAGVFNRHFQSGPLSVCGSLMVKKKTPLCPYQRKIKLHAWMTEGPLLWPPSSASILRSSSETTSALCCLLHWTHYNLHTAVTVPQTMLLPSVESYHIDSCFICIFNVSYRLLCIEMRIVSASVMEMHIPNGQNTWQIYFIWVNTAFFTILHLFKLV